MKSCGSGAAVLALSWREVPADDGGKRAVLREEHEVSRKAIAQGRPECSSCPVCSCATCYAQIARETAGAASTRSFLRPLFRRGQMTTQTSGEIRREKAKARSAVIASAAKQSIAQQVERWIASRSLSSGAPSRDPLARNDVDTASRSRDMNCPRFASSFALFEI